MSVRVRFAPSPTGEPHIGNIRTVVFNWLFARKMGGQFILRIEDTRSGSGTARRRFLSLWRGCAGWDWTGTRVPAWRNSAVPEWRTPNSTQSADPTGPTSSRSDCPSTSRWRRNWWRRAGLTVVTVAPSGWSRFGRPNERGQPPMYDRHCRYLPPDAISPDEPHVIRLKVPLTGRTTFHDIIRGEVSFENATIDDQILLKSDGFPTYHLAVVVDDHYMKVTYVIRGDDWVPSTPKHVLLYQALGWEMPVFCHVPLVTMPGGKKLAKREGATSITEFRRQGYLAEALLNFLALLGWAPGEGETQEIFSREELIERFDLYRVNRAPASFSYEKLDWMNGVYIRSLSQEDLLERLLPFWQEAGLVPVPCPPETRAVLRRIVPLIQERIKHLTDVVDLTDFFFVDIAPPPAEQLLAQGLDADRAREVLRRARQVLAEVPDFSEEAIEPPLRALVAELGLSNRQVFGLIRIATTGKAVSPPLFGTLSLLGRERVLARLEAAEGQLENR